MSSPIIIIAGYEDAADFHDVMQAAYESLDNKELYICDDYDYVRAILQDKNAGFGLMCYKDKLDEAMSEYDGKVCVGVLLVTFPGEAVDNLARDVFCAVKENEGKVSNSLFLAEYLFKTAHIESAAVRAEYRGNGIQNRLIEFACDYLSRNCGNIRYVMATVSPENIPSLKSFEKAGFKRMLTKEKYGGKLRHILMREINGGGSYG